MMFAIGPVFAYLDAYAHYYLGGRYPLLGNLLDLSAPLPPPSPVRAYTPPPRST